MRFNPGEVAYIVRPWTIDEDIGRPVTIIRLGIYGEKRKMRNGGITNCSGPSGMSMPGWLVDANTDKFPCFVADECLRKLGGDEAGDLTADEMVQLLGKPQEVTA